jgi:hypothetical protein
MTRDRWTSPPYPLGAYRPPHRLEGPFRLDHRRTGDSHGSNRRSCRATASEPAVGRHPRPDARFRSRPIVCGIEFLRRAAERHEHVANVFLFLLPVSTHARHAGRAGPNITGRVVHPLNCVPSVVATVPSVRIGPHRLLRWASEPTAPRAFQSPGPLQANGKCLLERPSHSHFQPKASTRSRVATPQVAT